MIKRNLFWIVPIVSIFLVMVLVPMMASAAGNSEAFQGLKEFFIFLGKLAEYGYKGLIEFFKAIV